MDAVTHILAGTAVAQIPPPSAAHHSLLTWKQKTMAGGLAAIFPDIDYAFFWINPLEFLAYWHRAETHSLILAPIWAWLIAKGLAKIYAMEEQFRHLFWISLVALISHILIDSLTTFGTQWFAPLTEYKVSWNLLFVIDPYFTLNIIFTLYILYRSKQNPYRYLAFLLPMLYLTMVIQIKSHISQDLSSKSQLDVATQATTMLLPLPFSPFYWQAIRKDGDSYQQTYLTLGTDRIAETVTGIIKLNAYQDSLNLPNLAIWKNKSILPEHLPLNLQQQAEMAWNHPLFTPFQHFSQYPVFLKYQQLPDTECFWFSDLRYHWPQITPSFRFAMCQDYQGKWEARRLKYFSNAEQKISK